MEVVVQSPSSPTMDNFDFGGTMSSPYLSAPSSPKRFGEYYLSAPASPSRLSQLYGEFDDSTIPFEAATTNDDDNGFAFYVNRESDKSSRSAEELFDGGKIKPLNESSFGEERRGRDRERSSATVLSSSNSGRRVARSHSPYRKSSSNYPWELEEQHPQRQQQQQQPGSNKEESTTLSGASLSSSSKSSRIWRLRDFLLFRSASEGRGSSKDPLKKYCVAYKKNEQVKGSSFRSSESSSAHGSRRRGAASAHELHYAMKKAESQDLKKRTFLPYKQGILGRLAGFGL